MLTLLVCYNNNNRFNNVQLLSDNTIPSIQNVGYLATIFLPYNHTVIDQYTIQPSNYTQILAHADGTFTVEYDFRGEKFNADADLTLSMVFPLKYPHCLKIRWPSITMWSITGGLVVFISVYVVLQCIYDQIKKRKTSDYDQLYN